MAAIEPYRKCREGDDVVDRLAATWRWQSWHHTITRTLALAALPAGGDTAVGLSVSEQLEKPRDLLLQPDRRRYSSP